MSKDKVVKTSKKAAKEEIKLQLEASLSNLKEALGEKKFNSRIKKAVKILSEGLVAKPVEEEQTENAEQVESGPENKASA